MKEKLQDSTAVGGQDLSAAAAAAAIRQLEMIQRLASKDEGKAGT